MEVDGVKIPHFASVNTFGASVLRTGKIGELERYDFTDVATIGNASFVPLRLNDEGGFVDSAIIVLDIIRAFENVRSHLEVKNFHVDRIGNMITGVYIYHQPKPE